MASCRMLARYGMTALQGKAQEAPGYKIPWEVCRKYPLAISWQLQFAPNMV